MSAFVLRESAIRSLCRWYLSLCQSAISSVYDPGSFQAVTSVLGLRGSGFLCKPWKREISLFPWRSSSPGHQSLRVSQPDVTGDHLPSAGLGLGSQMESSIPSLLRAGQREYSMVVIFLPLLDHCPEGVGSDQTTSQPLLPISMKHQLSYHFFFYSSQFLLKI